MASSSAQGDARSQPTCYPSHLVWGNPLFQRSEETWCLLPWWNKTLSEREGWCWMAGEVGRSHWKSQKLQETDTVSGILGRCCWFLPPSFPQTRNAPANDRKCFKRISLPDLYVCNATSVAHSKRAQKLQLWVLPREEFQLQHPLAFEHIRPLSKHKTFILDLISKLSSLCCHVWFPPKRNGTFFSVVLSSSSVTYVKLSGYCPVFLSFGVWIVYGLSRRGMGQPVNRETGISVYIFSKTYITTTWNGSHMHVKNWNFKL